MGYRNLFASAFTMLAISMRNIHKFIISVYYLFVLLNYQAGIRSSLVGKPKFHYWWDNVTDNRARDKLYGKLCSITSLLINNQLTFHATLFWTHQQGSSTINIRYFLRANTVAMYAITERNVHLCSLEILDIY